MKEFMVVLKPLLVRGENIAHAEIVAKMHIGFSPLKWEIDQIMPWPENQGQASDRQEDGEKLSEQEEDLTVANNGQQPTAAGI